MSWGPTLIATGPDAGEREALPDAAARVQELARLAPLDYERCRVAAAEELGVRVSTLDREVEAARDKGEEARASPFEAPEPWPDPVDGAELLDRITEAFRRYCVLPEHSPEALALWVVFAHCHDVASISPLAALVSPEKRCGKTTTLGVLSALVPKPLQASNISPAVLFRVIEKHAPTLLIDEADTFLRDNDELRGILNGGHNRLSAQVWRVQGDEYEPRGFCVWAPKAIAMIGRLPDTLEDRAIVIPLRRCHAGEVVERFRFDRSLAELAPLAQQAARWAADNRVAVGAGEPMVPEELGDRAQDNWRTLLAIADLAGGDWPERGRAAARCLSADDDAESLSAGVMMLRDVREVMGAWREMTSSELLERLVELEDAPWGEWRGGKPITARGVAKLLKPFGIRPYRGPGASRYRVEDMRDAWSRYLSGRPGETATSATSAKVPVSATGKVNEINDASQFADARSSAGAVAEGVCNRDEDADGSDGWRTLCSE